MRYIKTLCVTLFALLMLSLTVGGAYINAAAVEPTVAVGIHYKASGFYDRLLEVKLTGDHRYDTVAVALSQLGYHEGDCEEDMDGLNAKGSRNFAEYTRVWGKVDNQEGNGVSYGYAWCAAFVSWCLRQAKVPATVALTEISCSRMTNWYVKHDIFYPRDSGYTPILGDIIMFNEDDDITHVGLVLGVKDGKVYTVEGNGGAQVATHSYSLTSTYVHGYCVPQYTVKEGMDYNALMEGALNPVGRYIVTAGTLALMSEANSGSEKLTTLKEGDEVQVTGFEGNWCKIKHGEGEAYVSSGGITYEKYKIYTVKYNLKGGKGSISEQRKLLGDTITLGGKRPTKTGHSLIGWSTDKSAKTVDYEHGAEYSENADITLFAVWKPVDLTVTYYNEDGSVFEEIPCKYNDWLPEPETTPTKPDDDTYSYTFSGWDKEPDRIVVRNLKYTATFTATPLPPKAEEPEEGNRTWLVVTICSVSVLLAAGIATGVIKKKKKA